MSLPNTSAVQPAWAPTKWGPRWARITAIALCRTLWKVEVFGSEIVPTTGRSLVAANHTGLIDGPIMIGVNPRPTHFLVKGAFFKGALGVVMRACGQIPVVRGQGKEALQAGREVLKRGDSVGIFPEGRRGKGDVSELHPGVGWLSLHTGTPVIPVAVLGSRATGASVHALPKFRSRVIVVYGEPVQPVVQLSPEEITREHISLMTKQVQLAMQALLVEAQNAHRLVLPMDEGTAGHGTSNV